MTTMVQLRACVCLTRCSQICSASNWMAGWIVRVRFLAGTPGWTFASVSGIGWPLAPVSSSSLPSLPASGELYRSSSPAIPFSSRLRPLTSVKPSRPAARSPLGYERL
jgi:hypothetical protein